MHSDWKHQAKLIGYGQFSLVFRPPYRLPEDGLDESIKSNPSDFVGLITTEERYRDQILTTEQVLRELSSKRSELSNLIIMPVAPNRGDSCLPLGKEHVDELVAGYHAVRKKVEYEGTWKGKKLVQIVYPYAGKPLAALCKQPKAVVWSDFFKGMVEIASFLEVLHGEGYVHGDLSPNNLLIKQLQNGNAKFTIVDWNMLSVAEDFLQHKKGNTRVGCWSPEHFSLTTTRLQDFDENSRWMIYAEEMKKYVERLLEFSFTGGGENQPSKALREYFEPLTQESGNPVYAEMYSELKAFSHVKPSAVGKYHDLRYFMDTIAKCVSFMFSERNEAQQKEYNFFISLYLSQNLPQRRVYLEDPERLRSRLAMILESCENAERLSDRVNETVMIPAFEEEQIIRDLLK